MSEASAPFPEEKPASPEGSPGDGGFSSSHTSNFPRLLQRLGISLLVSTYQAGRLIVVRADGEQLNTHFRFFQSPMGVAYDADRGRLAIGTKGEIWDFQNQPESAPKLEPAGKHDAAFYPRNRHYTGDIRIHEIAWSGSELWAVNTRFSCLCTFDADHSFVPRWKPDFITALAPQDRCHLNGFTLVEGRPKYATCLGLTDAPRGWRENKRDGGALLDVDTHQVLLRGLSMPHSPRLHAGQFWFLESGYGSLSRADLATGETEIVARMPGFTRGLCFHGPLAFVGLSQVRETATFNNLPLLEEVPERSCGVWVIEWATGKTVAFLQFSGAVQEIFAIEVLPNILYPDLMHEDPKMMDSSFVLDDRAIAQVPDNWMEQELAAEEASRAADKAREAEELAAQPKPSQAGSASA